MQNVAKAVQEFNRVDGEKTLSFYGNGLSGTIRLQHPIFIAARSQSLVVNEPKTGWDLLTVPKALLLQVNVKTEARTFKHRVVIDTDTTKLVLTVK